MKENSEKKIIPQLAAGFRDYLPEDMIPRQKMFDIIRSVFECFGFVPLGTPGLEIESILTGGDPNFKMNIFKTNVQMGWDKLSLRFDLTVPLARVIAQYQNEIKKPFKRYQIGPVWRAEKPQAGRYREFVQFDADIVGSSSMMADAEIVAIMYATMSALGIKNFVTKVNNRKILNGLSEFAGFDQDKNSAVLRTIDKLDKIEWNGVMSELCDDKGDSKLSEEQAKKIKEFLDIKGRNQKKILLEVSNLMKNSPSAQEGIKELYEMLNNIKILGVPDNAWIIDLSVARGLGYYTGPVFETVLTDLQSIGSIFSGGRYDGLVERFSSISVPATGASVGVDRLFAALEQLGTLKKEKTVSKVMVLNFDDSAKLYVQEIATILRASNIQTEIYLGNETALKSQLGYANNADIPIVVIAGGDEMKRNVVQIKDMNGMKQEEVGKSDIIVRIKSILT